ARVGQTAVPRKQTDPSVWKAFPRRRVQLQSRSAQKRNRRRARSRAQRSRSGNAIAAENETARLESRKYRASCRAQHIVRRLEPRKNSNAFGAQEIDPPARIPRRRTGVQGGRRFSQFVQ